MKLSNFKLKNSIDLFGKYLLALSYLGGNLHLNAEETLKQEISPLQMEALKDWNYSLALQAATWGSPIVTMYALRYNDAIGPYAKAPPNTLWRMENITTPELAKQAGYVTPNVNVIYGFGFMDLRTQPVVIEAPDSNNRYYMIEIVDMWTNAFAYIGGQAKGLKGGKYVLVGPGYNGDVPANLERIDCPTPWVLIQPRVHIYADGNVDLDGAKKILQGIKCTALDQYLGKQVPAQTNYAYPAPQPKDPNLPVSALHYKDPLQFWEILSEAMNENPPPKDQITALLPSYKYLGLELNKNWNRIAILPEIVKTMLVASQEIGDMLDELPLGKIYQGAFIPPSSIGNFGADYKTRAVIARIGLTANIPSEAMYWIYLYDSLNKPLKGENKYVMNFKEEIPYFKPGFWSLTMYDATNNYTVPNPINRYMLGSDTKDLKKNADGSFTIYIQHDNPGKEKESNWLPAPPGAFYLIPRAYLPKPEIINILHDPKSWPIPSVEKVN